MQKNEVYSKHLENVEIEEFTFPIFPGSAGVTDVEDNIQFPELVNNELEKNKKKGESARLERHFSKNSGFEISPIVKEHRGIKDQEIEEREKIIHDEVKKRLSELEEVAFNKGFEEGVSRGRNEVIEKTREDSEEKLAALSAMISDVQGSKQKIFDKQKLEMYQMIKDLTKWVILKELKDDGQYLERLLEKLLLNMQETTNLSIQVNQKEFETMPEVLEVIEKKFGELTNVRVVVNYDIEEKGIILESKSSIIRGTIEDQMMALDKLFEPFGIFENENEQVDDSIEIEDEEIKDEINEEDDDGFDEE